MMNELHKRQWLIDLRSSNFQQVGGVLTNFKGGYCCLGVLCTQSSDPFSEYSEIQTSDLTPEHAFGLANEIQSRLADLNDHGYSFRQIAEVVENCEHRPLEEALAYIQNYFDGVNPENKDLEIIHAPI